MKFIKLHLPVSIPKSLKMLPAAVLVVSSSSASSAANVTMNANDALNASSYATALHWNNAEAPSPGNDYFTGAFLLRTPVTATAGQVFTFGGNSLTIEPGGKLLGKFSTSATVAFTNGPGLTLDAGQLHMANTVNDQVTMTVAGNISVTGAASSFGALGNGANNTTNFETLDIVAPVNGSSSIVVAGTGATNNNGTNTGVVRLSSANPGYTGTITVSQPNFVSSATNRLLQLNHPDALRNAALVLGTTAANPLSFTAAANTEPFKVGGLSGDANQRLLDTANNAVTLEVGRNGADSTYGGMLSGTGSLVKTGAGTLTLANVSFNTGNTTVAGGTLAMNFSGLADASTLTIASGARIHLPHGMADKVTALVLNGVSQPAGVYGANTPGDFITGAGSIEVYSGPPGPQNIIMTNSDGVAATVTTSLNGDIGNWSAAGAPAAGNQYFTGPYTIRTPATQVNQDITFAGASLTVNTGGVLLGKVSAGNTGNASVQTLAVNLILNGGGVIQAGAGGSTNGTLVIMGPVNVLQPAMVGAFGDIFNAVPTSRETLDFAGPISGSGSITVAGNGNSGANRGTVRLSASNPYTGRITVVQPTGGNMANTTARLLQLNHREALRQASLILSSTEADGISFTPTANTGAFRIGRLGGSASQKLEDTAGAPVIIDIGGNNQESSYAGVLSGAGSVVKSGTGTHNFLVANAYTGDTTIDGGTLHLDAPSLSDTGIVSIAAGATLSLLMDTDTVAGLVFNGVAQPAGLYDSTNSGGRITGEGKLRVTSGPAGGFGSFMESFPALSAAEKLPAADPDNDGLSNVVEYALAGYNPTAADNLTVALTSGTLSFTKRAEAVANADISYTIQTSTTLGTGPGGWTTATPAVNDATTISFLLPTGQGRIFARLQIVRP